MERAGRLQLLLQHLAHVGRLSSVWNVVGGLLVYALVALRCPYRSPAGRLEHWGRHRLQAQETAYWQSISGHRPCRLCRSAELLWILGRLLLDFRLPAERITSLCI